MKMIMFITGNKDKLREVRSLIPNVQGADINLAEIQELDAQKIIAAKLVEAQKHHAGSFIVEDTSLYLDAMNGLPGPFIKWYIKAIGLEGIYALTKLFGARATARTFIGYAEEEGGVHFFDGSISGTVVQPRGKDGFGWDAIFQPDGFTKTFAEMTQEDKHRCSMRQRAIEGLLQYLEQREKVTT